jgi:hypothetical protein
MQKLREPAFNLSLVANNAEMLRDSRGRVRTDANLTLVGPFREAKLGGRVDITQGVIYAPRPNRQHVIGANDPDLFNVLDTAAVLDRELFPLESPLLENIQVDVALGVARGTWLRSKEANVELYTEYPMVVHVDQSALTLTGTVTTERGEYNFLSKRFQISRGQATFLGTPDLNATLQVTGEFQVQLPNAPATNIQVVIGGTIKKPTVSLQSDAQPPRSQSELLSLLAFGQSTTSLLTPTGTSLASIGTTGDLVGVGAAIAMRRLTSVAADVLIDQLERELGRGLGADQFNITAGDVTELTSVTGEQTASNFIKETRIEAGKYLNPRTFVGLQEHAGLVGARIEYRTSKGWRYSAFAEPRIRLEPPTLAEQPFFTRQSYGAFVIREWRF